MPRALNGEGQTACVLQLWAHHSFDAPVVRITRGRHFGDQSAPSMGGSRDIRQRSLRTLARSCASCSSELERERAPCRGGHPFSLRHAAVKFTLPWHKTVYILQQERLALEKDLTRLRRRQNFSLISGVSPH